jgi:pimeloyl-ACP methyl ester carboxylesterase
MSGAISASVFAEPNSSLFLVHGAHFAADSWKSVQDQLKGDIRTIALNLPGRYDNFAPNKVSLELSAAALCVELAKAQGNKTVAVHSQAGAVINATLALCPDPSLKKIIYVTAVSPINGETPFELLSKQDENNYFTGINYNQKAGMLEISNSDNFAKSFAPEANASQKEWLKQHALPEPSTLGGNQLVLDQTQFNNIKKYYIFAKQDKVISLPSQKKIASRMKLTSSFTLNSGHLPMLTHSNELSAILRRISIE